MTGHARWVFAATPPSSTPMMVAEEVGSIALRTALEVVGDNLLANSVVDDIHAKRLIVNLIAER